MDNYDDAVLDVHPAQEPECVALGKQTIEEVKELLRKAEKAEKEREKELHKLFEEFTEKEEDNHCKLSYEEELSNCCQPDISNARQVCGFGKDVDVFALWRKLADVKVGNKDLEPEAFSPAKELMDYILLKLNRSFPKLKLSWSEDSWNPRLIINGSHTQISMEKLALAYQGLLNITEELSAQALICNIVVKKLKTLFI